MDESFDLPVSYNKKEMLYPARFQQLGYTYRILVDINGTEVGFEPDEEGGFRATVDQDTVTKEVNAGLLKAIAETIEAILK